ncbi:MAG: GDSL-type esterase/lipase family protein [Candidatus Omnitrophica bacterium]|nr:GDSL-type esterase/lipase family protein [Candidatus Omnitrophota bacterium]
MFKKALSFIFITLSTIFLLEAGLRSGGYLVLKFNPPSQSGRLKQGGETVILCLGDSFTFGVGAAYQDSYPRQLEGMLKERFPRKSIKVYNLGIPGSNSSQLESGLQRDIDKYHPDLVIVMSGRNDIWNMAGAGRPVFLLSGSRLYKLIKAAQANIAAKMRKIEENERALAPRKAPPEASRLITQGHDLKEQGRYDLAKECFLEALRIDPGNPDANRQLGTIYREGAEYELAEKCLTEAVRQGYGGDGNIYVELGMVHRIQNRPGLVREELRRALVDPRAAALAFIEFQQTCADSSEFYKEMEAFSAGLKDRGSRRMIKAMIALHRDKEAIAAIMRDNFLKIYKACRDNGVGLILQTYPETENVAEGVRHIADRYDIPTVDNHLVFEKELNGRDRREFFVSDDHCNAEGYRLIAEGVYEAMIREGMIDDTVAIAAKN